MNWGKSIVVVLVLFIGFIMYFVINMTTRKSKHDLVTEKYYQQELLLNDKLEAKRNVKSLKEKITIEKSEEGLKIRFPKELNSQNISGTVFFYRPSNKVLDFKQDIVLADSILIIDKEKLLTGRWNISISFQHNKKEYLYTEEIVY